MDVRFRSSKGWAVVAVKRGAAAPHEAFSAVISFGARCGHDG